MTKIYKGKIEGDLVLALGDDATAVTSVGGKISIYPRAKLNAPLLATIKGKPLPDPDTAKVRLAAVVERAMADPSNLIMNGWHNESGRCGTAHCIAGWAVHLEGKAGYDLEDEVGPETAGALLLGLDAASMFFLTEPEARSRLEMIRQGVAES